MSNIKSSRLSKSQRSNIKVARKDAKRFSEVHTFKALTNAKRGA